MPLSPDHIDTAAIEQICELNDDVYRNQWITHVYATLSVRLAEKTGKNANWFTFARWSSFTVGENLRLDKPSEAFSQLVDANPLFRFVRAPLTRAQHDLRMLSDSAMPRTLAIGNRLVFHEIGYAIASFLEWYDDLGTPTPEDWAEYRKSIRPLPPNDLFQACDVEWLRDGIESYFLAARETDPEVEARLMLRGNVLLAAYEQWRLGPIVDLALDPVAKHLVEFVGTNMHLDATEPQAILRNRGTPWAFRHRSPVVEWFSQCYARLLTSYVMAWQGPVAGKPTALFLGRGLPDRKDGTPLSPPYLDDPRDPSTLIVSVFDHSGGSSRGRRARNWANFTDRMNFIVNLFRAEQQDEELFAELSPRERRILDLDLDDEHLDHLRTLGDKPVDRAMAARPDRDDDDPRGLVRELVSDNFPGRSALYGDPALPGWAKREQLELGQRFLCEHGLEIGSALFFASLPFSYTAARGARVLARTAELTTGHASRRLAETGQMLLDLMTVDDEKAPLSPGTQASNAVRGVRLFHGAVRSMIRTDPDVRWNEAELGVPINQEDLMGTLIVFTVVVVDALEKLGVDFGSDEMKAARDAYVHFWLVVGHLIGIDYAESRPTEMPPTEQPLNLHELRLLQTAIFRRQSDSSLGGQTLMAALLESTKRRMPWFMKGYPVAATRGLLGQERADVLGVPPAGPARVTFEMMRLATRLFSPRASGQGIAVLSRISTKSLYRHWIDENAGSFPPWRLAAVPNWRLRRKGTPDRAGSGPFGQIDLVAATAEEERAMGNGRGADRVDQPS